MEDQRNKGSCEEVCKIHCHGGIQQHGKDEGNEYLHMEMANEA